jgi:hypothetical protein
MICYGMFFWKRGWYENVAQYKLFLVGLMNLGDQARCGRVYIKLFTSVQTQRRQALKKGTGLTHGPPMENAQAAFQRQGWSRWIPFPMSGCPSAITIEN